MTRSYVIVGATGGIGAATVRRLVAGGARVTAAARDLTRLRSPADELGVDAVCVDATERAAVAVAPGPVRTPGTERIASGPSGEASRAMHPLGRLGEPDDVASAIACCSILHRAG